MGMSLLSKARLLIKLPCVSWLQGLLLTRYVCKKTVEAHTDQAWLVFDLTSET